MGTMSRTSDLQSKIRNPKSKTQNRISALGIVIFVLCFGMGAGTIRVGEQPATGLPSDPLQGKWQIVEGREVKNEGFYFDASVASTCGTARFLDFPQRQVNFEPDHPPGTKSVPWGIYNSYEFDPGGILTLSRADSPKIRCFLKFKNEQMLSIGNEPPQPRLSICVFYDPEGRRAFKMFRMSEGIGRFATRSGASPGDTVFAPFEDALTGPWLILPSQQTADGQLNVRLDAPAPADATRLTVHPDNSVDLKAGNVAVRFLLRQFDPTHWAIVSPLDVRCATGTIALEQAAGRVVGPGVLITRWRIAQRTMTAVLQAEGTRRAPNIPLVRFENAAPLTVEALRPISPTSPTSPTGPMR